MDIVVKMATEDIYGSGLSPGGIYWLVKIVNGVDMLGLERGNPSVIFSDHED